MNKNDVMWKCNICDRIIPDSLYMVAKMHGVCECGEQYYWQFDKFILDKDNEICKSINISDDIEQKVKDIIKDNLEAEFEKTYRDGYSRGYEEGEESGYFHGYSEGYDTGRIGELTRNLR